MIKLYEQRQSKLEINFPSSLKDHMVSSPAVGKQEEWPKKPWDSGANCSSLPLHLLFPLLGRNVPYPDPNSHLLAPPLSSGLEAGGIFSMQPGSPSYGPCWRFPPPRPSFNFVSSTVNTAEHTFNQHLICDLFLPLEYKLHKGYFLLFCTLFIPGT